MVIFWSKMVIFDQNGPKKGSSKGPILAVIINCGAEKSKNIFGRPTAGNFWWDFWEVKKIFARKLPAVGSFLRFAQLKEG